jgi:uncharacterized membrane protein
MSSEVMSQSEIMRKNISAVMSMQRKVKESRTLQDRIADTMTNFAGSMAFVYLHAVWFGLWILLNVGLIHLPHVSEFDKFPFSLLTMVVSLEAIFLSTFVLVSQNRQSELSERRAELDLQVNLLAEQKATKVLEMLDEITKEMDGMSNRFNFKTDPQVQVLKVSPEPHEVLNVIEEAVEEEAQAVKTKVAEAVRDITGETEAIKEEVKETREEVTEEVEEVREDLERASGQLREVATDVKEIKREMKAQGRAEDETLLSLK